MDAKLQALFQTMASESLENLLDSSTERVLHESNQTIISNPLKDTEKSINVSQITNVSGFDILRENENEQLSEETENNHKVILKTIYKPSLTKPLHSSLIAGLNRLNGFSCPHCPRVLATKYSLQIHTLVHTGEKPHGCTVCPSKFATPGDLRRHMVTHTGEKPFKCDVCGAKFTQSSSLKGHSRLHPGEKPHKCQHCDESFVSVGLLKSHSRVHSANQLFKCTHCDEMFQSVELVMEHCKSFHTLSIPSDREDPSNDAEDGMSPVVDVSTILYGRKAKKKKSPCNVCGKILSSAYALSIHRRIHTGEKPYACKICDYKSACQSVLKRHVLKHSTEKPYKCDQCPKSFGQKRHLKVHQLTHENRKNKCINCSKVFSDLSTLLAHWRELHTDPERKHLCTKCFMEFESEETLEEHLKNRHAWMQNIIGNFECEKCGTKFNRKGNLKRHLDRNCQGKPFNCEKCGESFRKKNKLEEHMSKEHGVKTKYECKKCKKTFSQNYVLKMHDKKVHGSCKEKCHLCPKETFSSKKEFLEHKRNHFCPLTKISIPGTVESSNEKDKGPHPTSVAGCVSGKLEKRKNQRKSRRLKKTEKRQQFPCRICGKKFYSKNDVVEHFQSHRKNSELLGTDEEEDDEELGNDELEEEVLDSSGDTSDNNEETSPNTELDNNITVGPFDESNIINSEELLESEEISRVEGT